MYDTKLNDKCFATHTKKMENEEWDRKLMQTVIVKERQRQRKDREK